MKQIFAFEKEEDFQKYKPITQSFYQRLHEYQQILENEFALTELPKGIVWTTEELATTAFSDIPIPAYTNRDLIYMSPDLVKWRQLFIRQLDGKRLPSIQAFYESYSENQLFVVLAHELTHHSDLFLDDFDDSRDDGIWFEEGMCFYLPRKILLSAEDFNKISTVEEELVDAFQKEYGNHSLDDFGSGSYQNHLSSIMFDYWRSFLAVKYLVEVRANHDVKRIFDEYHKWHKEGRKVSLLQYFELD